MNSFRANSEGRIVCNSAGVDRLLNLDEARALEARLQGLLIESEGQKAEAELRRAAMSLAEAIMEAKALLPAVGRRVLVN